MLSDATHIVELYRIQGTTHADGLIMAYLPKEKLLVEVDVYTPAPPNAEAPPNWWTPLLSSGGSGKVSNGPGTASFYG